jgi:hypothetical protein
MVSIVFAGLIVSYSPMIQKLYTGGTDPVLDEMMHPIKKTEMVKDSTSTCQNLPK